MLGARCRVRLGGCAVRPLRHGECSRGVRKTCARPAAIARLPLCRRRPIRGADAASKRGWNAVARAVVTQDPTALDHSKTFRYGNGEFEISVFVQETQRGDQLVKMSTNHPSTNLILHWGVQGGKNYKGGWRLPSQRPPNTVQYKERALQTSWTLGEDGYKTIEIALDDDEASDHLNFVLKDSATNTWYDSNGSNFQMALRASLRSFASIDDAEMSANIFSLDEIAEIPTDLAGIWAYIKWEVAGCPNRSQEAADREYREGISEMQSCLCRGKTLDELWEVAKGNVKYDDFRRDFIDVTKHEVPEERAKATPAVAAKPATAPLDEDVDAGADVLASIEEEQGTVDVQEVFIPDDLVGIQAYLLWEKAGRPEGADFGAQARKIIEEQLRGGMTLKEVEGKIRSPPKKQAAPTPPPPPPQPGVAQPPTEALSNPLKLIKPGTVPRLSSEKKKSKESPLEFLVQAAAVDENTKFRRLYGLADGSHLLAVVSQHRGEDAQGDSDVTVTLTTDAANELVLHWGVGMRNNKEWTLPPDSLWPSRTTPHHGGIAAETGFRTSDDAECSAALLESRVPLQQMILRVPADSNVSSLQFVLRSKDQSAWYRDGSSNFNVPLVRRDTEGGAAGHVTDPLAMAIIDAESTSAWTLMHRFNRASDLLGEVMSGVYEDVPQAMATLFIWLRYSASRHLTWQRHYNTQPRILSSAQARLTNAIADAHRQLSGEAQEWARLMLSTVGRGEGGQQIRDEILNIMHRNHIAEKGGTWMEEWHQKLHNNTTPDDVPICEAYIAFLRANGDQGTYWRILSDAGITRERLQGYDRPIRCDPTYYGDKRNALIHDFENYLSILKSVHSGADLQNAAKCAGSNLPQAAKSHLGYVLASQGSQQVLPLIQSAVSCRLQMHESLPGNKNLLYLDLALEDVVRAAAERGVSSLGLGATAFVGPLLQNLVLTAGDNEELCYCLKAWQALPKSIQYGSTCESSEALQATAILDRIRRALGELSNSTVERVQPLATQIGENCGVEGWAVSLFAEEVVRGGPAFAVSLVLSTVEPALRRVAELGSWQIISPANCTGKLLQVASLADVQEEMYKEPTILLAKRVSGEEEIPLGAVAVITPDAPDVLSHASVRARNMKVLLATCHDPEPLEELRALDGKTLLFETTAAGGVAWSEADPSDLSSNGAGSNGASARPTLKMSTPKWCGKWALSMNEYKDGAVGAKSKNLAGLRGELPEWINLPSSVTLPFGCFEQALDTPANKEIKKELQAAAKSVADNPPAGLANCRNLVMQMTLPAELRTQLTAKMQEANIPLPESDARWAQAEKALIGVWASKFNDRAYFSMRKVGLDFMDLRMAVLVQRVVPARYAFVIHTKNPSTGNPDEVYCELVKGLGESLVSGTVPGSALAFTASKQQLGEPSILTYCSKSNGMFVRESLIFRSDSNGEDLAGYAGAGLYESITMDPTTLEIIDFSEDTIMTDGNFRKQLLSRICEVGLAIEQSMGEAQDIEGVVDHDGNITVVQTRPQV